MSGLAAPARTPDADPAAGDLGARSRAIFAAFARSSITSEVRIATSNAAPSSIRFLTDGGRIVLDRQRTSIACSACGFKFVDDGLDSVRSQHVNRRILRREPNRRQ